jgi:hypothetical protein
MPIADAPAAPSKKRTSSTSTTSKTTAGTADSVKAEQVEGILTWVQLATAGLMMSGNGADAIAIGQHGPSIVTEVVNLGDENESIRKAVEFITATGPMTKLITLVMPLALQLATNHKMINATGVPGVSDPRLLQAEAELAQNRMTQAAQERARAVEAELAEYSAMQRARETS